MGDETTALAVRQGAPTALIPTDIDQAIRLAKLMADGGLVPQHLQEKPANCLMVIEQAIRWGMSPFAVAQCTSVIQGKLMYEGKLVAAVVNARGELAERLRYTYDGQGRDRTCTVSGRLRGEDETRTVSVTWGLVKSANKVWEMQPDQQLAYYGARVWARRHLPEVMLGVYSPDEPFEEEGPSPLQRWVDSDNEPDPKAPTPGASPSAPPAQPSGSAAASTEGSGKPPSSAPNERQPGEDDDSDQSTSESSSASFRDLVDCWRKVEEGSKKAGTYHCEWVPIDRQPKLTFGQLGRIGQLRDIRGIKGDQWKDRLLLHFNKETEEDLSEEEANRLIEALEDAIEKHGTAAQKAAKQQRRAREMMDDMATMLTEQGIKPSDIRGER